MYIERAIKKKVEELKKGFPVVVITGPRQSGKTTFLQHNFPGYKYFNLEDPITLHMIEDDPVTFFEENSSQIILDEIQKLPELLSHIQVLVDKRKELGSILLSGSQNLLLSEKISQSLAGRAAYQVLYPLSFAELKKKKLLLTDRFRQMLKGGYPAVYTRDINPSDYFKQYISTYTERGVRQIRNVSGLSQFQKFMILLAGRVGQIVNVSSLASDVGVSPNTVEDWISILEASYIVYRLQPYFKNVGKRLIRSPKLFFSDTGLLLALLNINNRETLRSHPLIGSLFENFVVSEFIKEANINDLSVRLYFFRDSHGNEVDLILDLGDRQIPVEIKSSASYSAAHLKGIKFWDENIMPGKRGFVIYTGRKEFSIGNSTIISWENVGTIFTGLKLL